MSLAVPAVSFAQIGGTTYQRVNTKPGIGLIAKTDKEEKKAKKKKKKGEYSSLLTIGADQELTFPADLTVCNVYTSDQLLNAIEKASAHGSCEWIVLKAASDWEPEQPYWLQYNRPIVIENRTRAAEGHPLVVSNQTGRAIIFRAPKNGGCAVIIDKPDVAILGFTFEGAICQ